MVIFLEDSHSYWTKSNPKKRLYSPSSLLKYYYNEVPDYWKHREVWNMVINPSDYKVGKEIFKKEFKRRAPELYARRADNNYITPLKDLYEVMKPFLYSFGYRPKNHNKLLKIVEDRWEWENVQSTYKGSKFHLDMEHKMYREGKYKHFLTGEWFPVHSKPEMEYDNEAPENLSDLAVGIHPELLVYVMDWKLCGQVDVPCVINENTVDLMDYKTNKEKPSMPEKVFQYMKGSLSHLPDCHHIKYALQQSLYARMLEEAGWNIGKLALGWAPDYKEDNIEWIEVPYLKKEAEIMIEEHLERNFLK